MTWTPIPSDERTKLKVESALYVRAKCQCGSGKFALVVNGGPDAKIQKPPFSITQWQLVCLNCKQRHV